MTLRCLLVDDEPLAIDALRGLLARVDGVEVVGSAPHARAAAAQIASTRPDLVLLDIGMPGLSGLDFARGLREQPPAPLIVFVTAYDHFAAQAFDLDVADYVLKPVQHARLARALERARARHAQRGPQPADGLWLPYAGTMRRVALDGIQRLEAERDYVRVVTAERSYLMRATLSDLEQRLPPALFMRVHRSTLVRADRIAGVRHAGAGCWDLLDADGQPVRIGRSYLDAVRSRLGWPAPD